MGLALSFFNGSKHYLSGLVRPQIVVSVWIFAYPCQPDTTDFVICLNGVLNLTSLPRRSKSVSFWPCRVGEGISFLKNGHKGEFPPIFWCGIVFNRICNFIKSCLCFGEGTVNIKLNLVSSDFVRTLVYSYIF